MNWMCVAGLWLTCVLSRFFEIAVDYFFSLLFLNPIKMHNVPQLSVFMCVCVAKKGANKSSQLTCFVVIVFPQVSWKWKIKLLRYTPDNKTGVSNVANKTNYRETQYDNKQDVKHSALCRSWADHASSDDSDCVSGSVKQVIAPVPAVIRVCDV